MIDRLFSPQTGLPNAARRNKTWLYILQFIAGIVLYAGLLYLADLGEISELLFEVKFGYLIPAFILTFLLTFVISLRWKAITDHLAGTIVFGHIQSFLYLLFSRTVGFVLPKDLSDVASRIFILNKRHKLSFYLSANSIVIDRFFDLIVSLIFLIPSFLFVFGRINLQVAVALLALLITASGLLLAADRGLGLRLLSSAYNWMSKAVAKILRRRTRQVAPASVPTRVMLTALLSTIVKQVAIGLRAYYFGMAIGIDLSWWLCIGIASISQMSYLVSITPDGLGIVDATWFGLFLYLGLSQDSIALFLLEQRILVIVFIGVLTLGTAAFRGLLNGFSTRASLQKAKTQEIS